MTRSDASAQVNAPTRHRELATTKRSWNLIKATTVTLAQLYAYCTNDANTTANVHSSICVCNRRTKNARIKQKMNKNHKIEAME